MDSEQTKLLAASAVAIAVIIVVCVVWSWRRIRASAPPHPDQIAYISERRMFSIGGLLSIIVLVGSNAAAVIGWYAFHLTPDTVSVLVWLGNNFLWGLGAHLGRTRTYMVYKLPLPVE